MTKKEREEHREREKTRLKLDKQLKRVGENLFELTKNKVQVTLSRKCDDADWLNLRVEGPGNRQKIRSCLHLPGIGYSRTEAGHGLKILAWLDDSLEAFRELRKADKIREFGE